MHFPARSARRAAYGIVLALLLTTVPAGRIGAQTPGTAPLEGCIVTEQLQATSCRLTAGATIESEVALGHGGATWRLDLLAPDATLDLVVGDEHGSSVVSVLDWRGQTLATSVRAEAAEDARLSIVLPLPGVYGVRVSGDPPSERARIRLTADVTYPAPPPSPLWPPDRARGAASVHDDRHVIRVPRGGTPAAGVAAGRTLGAPPADMFEDFTLVADVRFERIVGPAAIQIRFRYEPEAGGGTGYLFALDPFAGSVWLDSFDEGQRRSLVGHRTVPTMPAFDVPSRLVLTAAGPSIRASLDGETVLEATDSRFARGLIAVGAVTWSDPVTVTFDHLQVTGPPR